MADAPIIAYFPENILEKSCPHSSSFWSIFDWTDGIYL